MQGYHSRLLLLLLYGSAWWVHDTSPSPVPLLLPELLQVTSLPAAGVKTLQDLKPGRKCRTQQTARTDSTALRFCYVRHPQT
jgi:hypothetical protein